jgi:hypothetical protein
MHTRRIATFLLGTWIGCSILMAFIAIQNSRSPDLIMNAPVQSASAMIETLGREPARLLLRHLAWEQNRLYVPAWEQVEIVLGLVLGGCLFLATQRRVFPMILCGLMLSMVLFQHIGITPELTFSGRETDFPPGSQSVDSLARVWLLEEVYIGVDAVKLAVGGILAAYLFVFRSSRRRDRKPSEALGPLERRSEHRSVGR